MLVIRQMFTVFPPLEAPGVYQNIIDRPPGLYWRPGLY